MSREIIGIGSETKPPIFVIGEYLQWKQRMIRFLNLIDKDLMKVIKEGPEDVSVLVNEQPVTEATPFLSSYRFPKPPSMYNNEQKQRKAVEERAFARLAMALPNDMYARVDSLKSAKDIWLELELQMQGGEKAMESKRENAMCAYEGFSARESESLTESYNRLNTYINDLRQLGMEKTKYELNIKFLKNLHSEWRQVAINLQMSQNLGQFGLHDLYSMLVQHEDLISGEKKESSPLALIAGSRTSTNTKSSSSQVEITDNKPVFVREFDESDEDLKKLTSSMSMFARDINKYKETKEVDKYRPPRRPEAPYRPTERYPDSYQKEQYDDDRYRPNDRPDNRYRQPDRRYDDYYRQTEPYNDRYSKGESSRRNYKPREEYREGGYRGESQKPREEYREGGYRGENQKEREENPREDPAVIISKEEMRETKHTVRRNGTRRINKKMIAKKWSDMKRS